VMRSQQLVRTVGRSASALIIAVGALLFIAGSMLAVTATPVEAASVSCNATHIAGPLVPGASGRCTFVYWETPRQTHHQAFTVTLDVDTVATSGGGSGGTASEALLDGRATGLQVKVSDSAGNRFGIGSVTCAGAYPHAASCSSADHGQPVRRAVGITTWSDRLTLAWSLPRNAGNPYQGGSAIITVTAHFNGVPVAQPSPSPSPTGGVLAATTPSTGAGSVPLASLALIIGGIGFLFSGVVRIGSSTSRRPSVP